MKFLTSSSKSSRKPLSSNEALRLFQNLYLFPIELQRLLKKTLKKPGSGSKKQFLSFLNSKAFSINCKNPPNFCKNLQKVQLLTSLQEKQVEEIIRKDPEMMRKPVNGLFLHGFTRKTQRNNSIQPQPTPIQLIEEQPIKPETIYDDMPLLENPEFADNFSEFQGILDFNESALSKNLEEFNEPSTKDEGFFELENLDSSQSFTPVPNSVSQGKGTEFIAKINRILGGEKVTDLTDLVISQGNECLMRDLLEDKDNEVYL